MSDPGMLIPADYFRRLEKAEIFDRPGAPLEVDVGSGDGTFVIEMAARFPERDFLGIERLLGRARKIGRKARRRGLTNAKALRLDSTYAVPYLLPLGGVSRLHVLCPDPWPKKKHERHRLIKPEFCAAVHAALEPGGEWLFKTDHPEYYEESVATIRATALFDEIDWPEAAFFYPQTDFELQWLAEGRTIQRARFRRKG